MTDNQLSPTQSLALIDSMINQARNRFTENGFLYLLWGWLVFASALAHFFLISFTQVPHPEMVWLSCFAAGLVQFIYLSRRSRTQQVKSYSDEILQYVWVTFGVCMTLMSLIVIRYGNWSLTYALTIMLYGVPTFLSGVIMQFRPLKAGGIACWILSAITGYTTGPYILLLIAAAVLIAWVIPGYLLRRKFLHQSNPAI
jgi:hypothetical protein